MNNENIVVKGTMQKNEVAARIFIYGIFVAIYSLYEAFFLNDLLAGKVRRHDYSVSVRDYGASFFNFFVGMTIIGIVAIIVGIVIKVNTEECEITVTNKRIYGKTRRGKAVDIPINQITALHTCSFKGVSISSVSGVSNFYLIENREEIIKAISFLLTNPQEYVSTAEDQLSPATNNETDKLVRLKKLMDAGIISQEEFDTKKKQILSL